MAFLRRVRGTAHSAATHFDFLAAGFFFGAGFSSSLPGAESESTYFDLVDLLARPRDSRGAGASSSLDAAFLGFLAGAFLAFLTG